MKESQEGRNLHSHAEDAREKGDFTQALQYTDEALVAYQKDGDLLGLAEVLSSRQIVFKHLYNQTKAREYQILQKHAAMASVEIAELLGQSEALGIPYFNLGKYYFEASDYQNAVEYFEKAVDNLSTASNSRHSKASVIADIKGHLYVAQYYTGDKSALDRSLEALENLMSAQEESYEKNVWVSGAHLRIARMMQNDQPDLSREHLQKAKDIIENDERLVLRKKQLEELEQQFS